MAQVGNVGIGGMFLYNGAIFVVMPFDWEDEKYYNLCVATRNRDDYDIGDKMWLDEKVEVQYVPAARIKDFIPKDWQEGVGA
jgi:hypothetical protein